MLKPLSLLSISAAVLLASTQSYGHVLCAPNNPHIKTAHTHGQSYTVPRIAVSNQHNQRFLQEQRARQQKALANQQRINQQRRAQAQRRQQQEAARKAQIIRQQQLAAQKARATRQQAAQLAAQRAVAQRRAQQARAATTVYQKPVYVQQPAVRYVQQPAVQYVQQPAVTYVQPRYVPQPVYYTPSRSSFSVTVGGNSSNHSQRRHRAPQARHVVRYPRQQRAVRSNTHYKARQRAATQNRAAHHRANQQRINAKRANYQRHQWRSSGHKSSGHGHQTKGKH